MARVGVKHGGVVDFETPLGEALAPPVAVLTFSPSAPTVGETVTLDARGSSDPAGGSLIFDFYPTSQPSGSAISSSTGGANWMENDPTNGVTTFSPTYAGAHNLKVNVKSSVTGLITSDEVSFTVASATNNIAGDQTADTSFLEPSKDGFLWRLAGAASPWDKNIAYSINTAEADTPNNYDPESRTTPEGTRQVLISYHDGDTDSRYGVDLRLRFENIGLGRYTELYMRYYRMTPTGFRRTQGKEPGLQGTIEGGSEWWPNSGYGSATVHDHRQFGGRTMFKTSGMITYLNVVEMRGKRHDGMGYSFSYRYKNPSDGSINVLDQDNRWYYIEQRVKLNPVGEKNGIFEGWIDGVKMFSDSTIVYLEPNADREAPLSVVETLRIDKLNLVQFYGGGTSEYPTSPTKVAYKDFVISTKPIGARL